MDPKHPKKVYKVVKALYGLHQAPRAWYATLSTFLLKNGYRKGTIDKTLFIKKDSKDIILVQVYVDDIIFGSTKKAWCDEFEDLMQSEFEMSSMGELTFFLGLQVEQRPYRIFISQDKYVAKILRKFDLESVKTSTTPYKPQKPKDKNRPDDDVNIHFYRLMIGSLMYLTASRPDIMFAVSTCPRFQVTPKTSNLLDVKRIFKYLKGQPKLGLWYPRDSPFELEAYTDSDYAGNHNDRCFTWIYLDPHLSKGIKRDYSNARTPQQNGVAERKNRTLIEAARTMLADSFLPTMFWTKAVATACYVLNSVLVTNPHNKTPYELLTGIVPTISYLKPFGCHVTILNTIDQLGKFDGKSDEGFLVGYSTQGKAYRVYNLASKRAEETMNVKFLENKPNVAQTGPAWYFDLDYLTDSMDYSHVRSTNPSAGPSNATTNNAGSQDTNDSDTDDYQDVIILPSYPSNATSLPSQMAPQDSSSVKSHSSPVVEGTQAEMEELVSLERQKHEANAEAERLGSEFAQATEDLVFSAAKSFQTPSTNAVTPGTPVTPGSAPFATSTSPGILSASASSLRYHHPSTFANEFATEDIYDNPVTYYQDKEADGVGLILWGDLRVLIDSPEVDDGKTVSGLIIYMFVDKKYPLTVKLMERMLDYQLEIGHGAVGNELTTAVQLVKFLKKQIADSKRAGVHDWYR
ncbi:putative ribonuclease H-like domain-containing protein [Tanacetum coccineum]